jgi:hypothetical protein
MGAGKLALGEGKGEGTEVRVWGLGDGQDHP